MLTARLTKIEPLPKARLCYAHASVTDPDRPAFHQWLMGIGFMDAEDSEGKYDALWDLAKVLTRLNIEVA